MRSEVPTGRRMKMREGFIAAGDDRAFLPRGRQEIMRLGYQREFARHVKHDFLGCASAAAARAAWPRMRPQPSALARLVGSLSGGTGLRAALAQQHLGAILELIRTIDDHSVPGLEAVGDGGIGGIPGAECYFPHADGLIGVD